MSPLQAAPTPAGEVAPVSVGYRTYAVLFLTGIYTLGFIDRQIIVILAEHIKIEFALRDWQVGVLTGLAFAILYTVMGVPIARMADRHDRPRIIAASVAVWSIFTMACGYAQTFVQLALARLMVGVGEAGCTPPSHSLISDYVPKEKRSSALAIYSTGIPLGGLLGMALGGLVADAYGWRTAFIVAGLPGLLIAVLTMLTLRDPRPKTAVAGRHETLPLRDAIAELFRKRSFKWICVAGCFTGFINYGQGNFFASFFFRTYPADLHALAGSAGSALGVTLGAAGFLGVALGLTRGLMGIAGTLAGGWLADWAVRRDLRAFVSIPLVTTVLRIPLFWAAALAPDAASALVLIAIHTFVMSMAGGPAFASVQTLAPPHLRATASALYLIFINLVGMGLGPMGVGLLSDALADSGLGLAEGLRWALILSEISAFVAIALLWLARRDFRKDAAA